MDLMDIRKNLSTALFSATLKWGLGVQQLAIDAGLPQATVNTALVAGVIDAVDLIQVCRVLGLDAAAVLAAAANHGTDPAPVGTPLADVQSQPTSQPQPEQYPA